MFKKVFFILILFFIILGLAIAFIGPMLISGDKVKNRVRETIREKYQYDVEIDSFRLFFLLGVKARLEGVKAKSLAEGRYGLDVTAKAFSASIKLLPLFYRKIEIGRILINEPVVILEERPENDIGAVEKDKGPAPAVSKTSPAKKETKGTVSKSPVQSFSIAGFVIRNGKIKVKSRTLLPERIEDVEFAGINLSVAPLALNRLIDVKLRGRLAVSPVKEEKIFLRPVEISLVQKIKIDREAVDIEKLKFDIESISISLEGSFSDFEKPVVQGKLSTGEINLGSLKDFINFTGEQGMSGGLKFDGALSGPLDKYTTGNLKGKLELKEAEFKGLFPNAVCKMNGGLDLTSSSVLKEVLSGNLDNAEIKGRLLLSQGSFNEIKFQDLSSDLSYKNNIIDLAPVEFSLYDGGFNGAIRATINKEPGFNFKAEVKGISIEKFLADTCTMKDTIYGKVYSRLEVAGEGKDLSRITETLRGNMHVEMKDGKITTLNLLKDILSVAGILTGMQPPEGDYTRVDVLTADVVIADGKASTDNLHLFSKGLQVVGKGYFNFDQSLNFIMDAYLGTPREGYEGGGGFLGKYMKDKYGRLVVPIKVTGTVARPHVTLDAERLTANLLEQQIFKDLLPKIFK